MLTGATGVLLKAMSLPVKALRLAPSCMVDAICYSNLHSQ
jgi:hypothetical protein